MKLYLVMNIWLLMLTVSCSNESVISLRGGSEAEFQKNLNLATTPTILTIPQGTLSGIQDGKTVAFKGIPYAAAPVGAQRWQAPSAPPRWAGTRDAKNFGSACISNNKVTDSSKAIITGSEDCLFLNVWMPSTPSDSLQPVLVFIHGGGLSLGSSSQGEPLVSLYTGRHLAEKGMVVVTINYRLGIFGFFTPPKPTTVSSAPSPNLGTLDQLAALTWVRDNVRYFGGDPARVTIAGESAGSVSVGVLLISPLAQTLYHQAIMESSVAHANPADRNINLVANVAAQLKCADAPDVTACLLAKSAKDIVTAAPGMMTGPNAFDPPYYPMIDGYVIPDSPRQLIADGKIAPVDVLIGSNASEWSLFQPLFVSPTQTETAIATFYGSNNVAAVEKIAGAASFNEKMIRVGTWTKIECGTREFAQLLLSRKSGRVFRYEFTYAAGFGPLQLPPMHGAELPFVFGSYQDVPGFIAPPKMKAFGDNVIATWAGFIIHGAPSMPSNQWPLYDQEETTVVIDSAYGITKQLHAIECDSLEPMIANGRLFVN